MSRRGRRLPDGRRMRRHVHPQAVFGPVVGSVAGVVAWTGVARSSGSGWVQAVGALVAAVLGTGLVAPALAASRARVCCVASPSDAVAGSPVTVEVAVRGPARLRPLSPPGTTTTAAGPARGERSVAVEVVPPLRGVVTELVLSVDSSAPFGLLWWGRHHRVALARPLHVAPRATEASMGGGRPDDRPGDTSRLVPAPSGLARSVRPYVPGDRRHAVHWPGTAHAGSLMVREAEQPTDEPVVVEVVLPDDLVAAERTAGEAMATLVALVGRGEHVVLVTDEPGGRVVAPVADVVDAGRRLARAVARRAGAAGGGAAPGTGVPAAGAGGRRHP